MIYEVRTYTVTPHKVPEVMRLFGEAYPDRAKISPMLGFFYTDIGPLNQVIHIWGYESIEERARIRAEAVKLPNWPPNIAEFMESQQAEIFTPWSCVPPMTPGKHGPIYEYRSYIIKAGAMAGNAERWGKAIPARAELSPAVAAMHTELGTLNRFVHIWTYESLDQRAEVRAKAVELGVWPPKGAPPGSLISQENKIMLPAPFSPMQ
jgi:hypothetical protein